MKHNHFTLRQVIDMLKERDGEDFEKALDLPLYILVSDDHRNIEIVDIKKQWPETRAPDYLYGSEYHGALRLTVHLDDKRLVNNSK